jgi:two-component system, OmpR family, response regulator VicR
MSMKKILIAEDDSFLCDSYQDILTQHNIEVVIAHDGLEATRLAFSAKPDLIVLDLVMPKKNGMDVLKELKKNIATNGIPVIIASNIDQKEVMNQTRELGAQDFYIKSNISLDDFYQICAKYLG